MSNVVAFYQFVQADAGIMHKTRLRPFPAKTMSSESLAASLNNPRVNKNE